MVLEAAAAPLLALKPGSWYKVRAELRKMDLRALSGTVWRRKGTVETIPTSPADLAGWPFRGRYCFFGQFPRDRKHQKALAPVVLRIPGLFTILLSC